MAKKEQGFTDMLKDGLNYVSRIVSSSIFPPMERESEKVMAGIDKNVILIEKRVLNKVSILSVVGLGGLFLIFALFFLLKELFNWTSAASFFFIGITIFVIGLLLMVQESSR